MGAIKGGFLSPNDNWNLGIALIDNGANPSIKDKEGKTALNLFEEKPSSRFCKLKRPLINKLNKALAKQINIT